MDLLIFLLAVIYLLRKAWGAYLRHNHPEAYQRHQEEEERRKNVCKKIIETAIRVAEKTRGKGGRWF